jgi:hypothetical protein
MYSNTAKFVVFLSVWLYGAHQGLGQAKPGYVGFRLESTVSTAQASPKNYACLKKGSKRT